ncbi:MAG: hypothetical protein QM751_11110 [Paludibacteraceae bacterium]
MRKKSLILISLLYTSLLLAQPVVRLQIPTYGKFKYPSLSIFNDKLLMISSETDVQSDKTYEVKNVFYDRDFNLLDSSIVKLQRSRLLATSNDSINTLFEVYVGAQNYVAIVKTSLKNYKSEVVEINYGMPEYIWKSVSNQDKLFFITTEDKYFSLHVLDFAKRKVIDIPNELFKRREDTYTYSECFD